MADVFSAECLEGFCSQCTFLGCACLHHLEDQYDDEGDFDDGDFDDGDFEFDCGMLHDGTCMKAGSEECDWECPFSGTT